MNEYGHKDSLLTLAERDQKVVWHPFTQMLNADSPIPIISGEGAYLTDDTGKQYIDAVSSWWVNLHGHSHPYIIKKMMSQLLKLEHVIFAGFTHEPAVLYAEMLLSVLPPNQARVFYSDNGSTAVEVALKMALQYWYNQGKAKTKIIALNHSYHGDTFGSMSVSARSTFTAPYNELLFQVEFIDIPVTREEQVIFEAQLDDSVAAFIFEPLIQGSGGMHMYEPETLNQMLEICRKKGILTIADEVMTGFGRTGKLFAVDHLIQKPDIICLSKGITGGTMPMGATTCTASIYDAFLSDDKGKTFFHGHSYTANPLACSAAIASLELLLKRSSQQNISIISQKHAAFAQEISGHPKVSNLRHLGTIIAFDWNTGEQTSYFHDLRNKIYHFFLEKGILLRPLGNVIYIMPPYCVSIEDLDYIYEKIQEALNTI